MLSIKKEICYRLTYWNCYITAEKLYWNKRYKNTITRANITISYNKIKYKVFEMLPILERIYNFSPIYR